MTKKYRTRAKKKKGPIINRTWEKGQTGKAQKMFYVMPKW